MIDRPEELFETFKKQSIDSREYDGYSVERDRNARELEKLDRQETAIEIDYYEGKHTEEKKEKLVGTIAQKKGQLIVRNEELDQKMNAILKAEETRSALEKFTKDFTTSLENLTFEQKKFLVDLLVESIEVTTVSSQLNLNIKLRFDQSKVGPKGSGYEPKTPTTKPKDGSNGGEIDNYGATDWARTSDLLLRREAL